MDLHLQLWTLSLTYLILTQIVLDLSLTIVKPSINVKMFLLIGVKYQFNYWKKNYYGVSGQRKGLVDPVSGFGVKGPLSNAIITQDYHATSSTDIFDYLTKINEKAHFKYFDINNETKNKCAEMMHRQLKIPDCMKQHVMILMVAFNVKKEFAHALNVYKVIWQHVKLKKENSIIILPVMILMLKMKTIAMKMKMSMKTNCQEEHILI